MPPRRPDARNPRVRRRQNNAAAAASSSAAAEQTPRSRSAGSPRPTDAVQLLAKMRRQSEVRNKAAERVSRREETIRTRYADPSIKFDKDDLLANLIADTRSNFLRLDQELSEDHGIATHRLHTAVFSHATDFLQLFRDVNRSSALVQNLKGTVQGTKAAISAISKFTMYDRSGGGSGGGSPNDLFGDLAQGAAMFTPSVLTASAGIGSANLSMKGQARPSLIASHLAHLDGSSVTRLTTRSLNSPSVRLWRHTTLFSRKGRLAAEGQPTPINEAPDILLFADVLREEVLQVVAERRHLEAAEMLRNVEADAAAKGCLPLLLELEETLVEAITTHLYSVPMPLMYSENIHIPLVQLLLRFGLVRTGSISFFKLHADWLNKEMNKLQLRMDPQNGARIATDFLVCAVREILQRQQNIWISAGEGSKSVVGKEGKDSKAKSRGQHGGALTMPPSSTAVLWVRDRIDKLAREILGSRALSYGIGAEGGDPSRFRRAVLMAADAIRTVRRMEELGYDGCDTYLLRMLTPSLVYLQADFAGAAGSRVESTGRTMMDHLTVAVRKHYESRGASYKPRLAEDVARKNNRGCRELHQRLLGLPRTSFLLLLELFLAPASSSLFARPGSPRGGGGGRATGMGSVLPPERYIFLRYSNGCTRLHGLLLSSMIRFIAAMTGNESLPSEFIQQQEEEQPQKPQQSQKQYSSKQQQPQETKAGDEPLSAGAAAGSRESQAECVSFLFSNALVTESLDVTLQHLFLAFMRTSLRQRQALVAFLNSAEFAEANRQFPRAGAESNSKSNNPNSAAILTKSSPWILDAMVLLLSDVLSVSVWVAFLARGGALSQMLADGSITFRVRYLEELRHALPRLAQGWLAATLSLAFNPEAARDILLGNASNLPSEASLASATTTTAAAAQTAGVDGKHMEEAAAAAAANYCAGSGPTHEGVSQLEEVAAVNESKIMPFLFDMVRSRFTASGTNGMQESALQMLLTSPATPVWGLRNLLGNYPQFPLGTTFDRSEELFLFHWCTQISLNVLSFFQERLLTPSFAVNERWASERAGSTPITMPVPVMTATMFPLRGCISPYEESVLTALAAGGGNYGTAVALLQFIIFRLLRDVLCRVETWSTMYSLPPEKWRQAEDILRQQLFFFALFVRIWSPLFVGSMKPGTALTQTPTSTSTSPGGGGGEGKPLSRPFVPNRTGNADRAPAMAPLQWLTCATASSSFGVDLEAMAFSSSIVLATTTAAAAGDAAVKERTGNWRSSAGGGKKGTPAATAASGAGNAHPAGSTGTGHGNPNNTNQNNNNNNTTTNDVSGKVEPSALLLGVVSAFFDTIAEPRALPAITSDVMRARVDRVMNAVNLTDFAGRVGLTGSDADEEEELEEDEEVSSSSSSRGARSSLSSRASVNVTAGGEPPSKSRVTLQHVHDLLLHYVTPLL